MNAVAPGQIATRMTGQEDQAPAEIDVPLGRAGHAREAASYVIDGGLTLIAAERR